MAESYRFVDEEPTGYKFVDEPVDPRLENLMPMQKRMGLGRKGDTAKKMSDWVDQAPYEAGGYVTDKAAKILPAEGAAALGYLTNVGLQAIPMAFGGGQAKAAAPVMEAGAKRLMSSALKPTLEQQRTGKAARAVDTLLDEGVNATKGGAEQLKGRIGEVNNEIVKEIANATATVNKVKVGQALRDPLQKFQNQVNPEADVAAVKSAWTEFSNHPALKGRMDMPVQVAQQMKQGTYKALGDKSYGELKGASTEAQKALARGLKDEISAAVPSVGALNKTESELINALKVTERRALMDMNKNPMGLAILAHNPASWAAFMADKSALFKSLAARMMYSGSEQIPATIGRAGVGALMAPMGQPRGALYPEE